MQFCPSSPEMQLLTASRKTASFGFLSDHLKPVAFLFCHPKVLEGCFHLIGSLHAIQRLVLPERALECGEHYSFVFQILHCPVMFFVTGWTLVLQCLHDASEA